MSKYLQNKKQATNKIDRLSFVQQFVKYKTTIDGIYNNTHLFK